MTARVRISAFNCVSVVKQIVESIDSSSINMFLYIKTYRVFTQK